MKVWYLKNRHGRGGKFFTSEKAYLNATHKDDTRLLHILEVTSVNGVKSGDYFTGLLLERERDEQLSIILDETDNFTRNFAMLKCDTKIPKPTAPGGDEGSSRPAKPWSHPKRMRRTTEVGRRGSAPGIAGG